MNVCKELEKMHGSCGSVKCFHYHGWSSNPGDNYLLKDDLQNDQSILGTIIQ